MPPIYATRLGFDKALSDVGLALSGGGMLMWRFWGLHFPILLHIEKYQFFILVIQCPAEDSGWYSSVGAKDKYDADAKLDFPDRPKDNPRTSGGG